MPHDRWYYGDVRMKASYIERRHHTTTCAFSIITPNTNRQLPCISRPIQSPNPLILRLLQRYPAWHWPYLPLLISQWWFWSAPLLVRFIKHLHHSHALPTRAASSWDLHIESPLTSQNLWQRTTTMTKSLSSVWLTSFPTMKTKALRQILPDTTFRRGGDSMLIRVVKSKDSNLSQDSMDRY